MIVFCFFFQRGELGDNFGICSSQCFLQFIQLLRRSKLNLTSELGLNGSVDHIVRAMSAILAKNAHAELVKRQRSSHF